MELSLAAGLADPHEGPGKPWGQPGEYRFLWDAGRFYGSDTVDRKVGGMALSARVAARRGRITHNGFTTTYNRGPRRVVAAAKPAAAAAAGCGGARLARRLAPVVAGIAGPPLPAAAAGSSHRVGIIGGNINALSVCIPGRLRASDQTLCATGGSGPEAGADLFLKVLEAHRAALGEAYTGDADAPAILLTQVPAIGGGSATIPDSFCSPPLSASSQRCGRADRRRGEVGGSVRRGARDRAAGLGVLRRL